MPCIFRHTPDGKCRRPRPGRWACCMSTSSICSRISSGVSRKNGFRRLHFALFALKQQFLFVFHQNPCFFIILYRKVPSRPHHLPRVYGRQEYQGVADDADDWASCREAEECPGKVPVVSVDSFHRGRCHSAGKQTFISEHTSTRDEAVSW